MTTINFQNVGSWRTWGDRELIVQSMIRAIGDDPTRDGLKETPGRVVKMWMEMFSGYGEECNLEKMLKTFENDGSYDQMIVVQDLEFTSFCEHHMMPFQGVAHVGYVPSPAGRIVGLSKLGRLVDVYAKRLQVQERLTQQVAKAVHDHLKPLGSVCVIQAKHSCMSCRGVKKQQSRMSTTALYGCFKDEPETRSEFYSLIRGGK